MINGSDLLMYSQMKQRQADLLCEASGLHRARKAALHARARRMAPAHEPTVVDPGRAGFLRPADGSPTRVTRTRHDSAGTPPRPGTYRSTPLKRFAASFGTRLIAVGRRLERIDRR